MPVFAAGYAAYCQAKLGRIEEARHSLRRMEESRRPGVSLQVALARLGLDDLDGAFAWLDRAFDNCCLGVHWVHTHPLWKPVNNHPRFVEMLARRGLK
jgi:hypothetical protein